MGYLCIVRYAGQNVVRVLTCLVLFFAIFTCLLSVTFTALHVCLTSLVKHVLFLVTDDVRFFKRSLHVSFSNSFRTGEIHVSQYFVLLVDVAKYWFRHSAF
jgi:hypothetical protein